jgi:hypothetical protein
MYTIKDNISVKSLNECSICFGSLNKNNKIQKLSCSHEYHTDCINTWFTLNKTCPLCRSIINTCDINVPQNTHINISDNINITYNINSQNHRNHRNHRNHYIIDTCRNIKKNMYKICCNLFTLIRILICFGLIGSSIYFTYVQHNTILDIFNFIKDMNTTEYLNITDLFDNTTNEYLNITDLFDNTTNDNTTIKNIIKNEGQLSSFELFTTISTGIYVCYLLFHICMSVYYVEKFSNTVLFAIINGLYLINLNNIGIVIGFDNETNYPNISSIFSNYNLALTILVIFYIVFNIVEYIEMYRLFVMKNSNCCVCCYLKP